jgi:hypothetical protein
MDFLFYLEIFKKIQKMAQDLREESQILQLVNEEISLLTEKRERLIKVLECLGCLNKELNQQSHYGGCLPDLYGGETWEDFEIIYR